MKICTRCKKEKELSDFYKHKHGKDGHFSICGECYKEKNQKRYLIEKGILLKTKNMPRCILCEILLNNDLCSCGVRHGEESKTKGVCATCAKKGKA